MADLSGSLRSWLSSEAREENWTFPRPTNGTDTTGDRYQWYHEHRTHPHGHVKRVKVWFRTPSIINCETRVAYTIMSLPFTLYKRPKDNVRLTTSVCGQMATHLYTILHTVSQTPLSHSRFPSRRGSLASPRHLQQVSLGPPLCLLASHSGSKG